MWQSSDFTHISKIYHEYPYFKKSTFNIFFGYNIFILGYFAYIIDCLQIIVTAKYDNNSFHTKIVFYRIIKYFKCKISFLHVCASHHDKTKIHMATFVVDMWYIWMHPIIQQIINRYYDKLINFSCL